VSEEFGLQNDVSIAPINDSVYMLKHESGEKEIYFISNQDELASYEIRVSYARTQKTAMALASRHRKAFDLSHT